MTETIKVLLQTNNNYQTEVRKINYRYMGFMKTLHI